MLPIMLGFTSHNVLHTTIKYLIPHSHIHQHSQSSTKNHNLLVFICFPILYWWLSYLLIHGSLSNFEYCLESFICTLWTIFYEKPAFWFDFNTHVHSKHHQYFMTVKIGCKFYKNWVNQIQQQSDVCYLLIILHTLGPNICWLLTFVTSNIS